MLNSDEFERLVSSFNVSNDQINELLRLQDETNQRESEFLALQIRFVHKTKQNEEYLTSIEEKTRQFNEKSHQFESLKQRFDTLKFEYNGVQQKNNLTIECIDKIKKESSQNQTKLAEITADNEKLLNEKNQIKDYFTKQVDSLEDKMKKVLEESEMHVRMIKELRAKSLDLEERIEKSNENNLQLIETNNGLNEELRILREKFEFEKEQMNFQSDSTLHKQAELEMELLKTKSKLDESLLELNELKASNVKQSKLIEFMRKHAQEREHQYAALQESFKINSHESRHLLETSSMDKSRLETKFNELQIKMESSLRLLEQENASLIKKLIAKESFIEKLNDEFNSQQILIENLINCCKKKEIFINEAKKKLKQLEFKFQFHQKSTMNLHKELIEMQTLRKKLHNNETKCDEQQKRINDLEQEIAITKNSLDSSLDDISNLTSLLASKTQEAMHKNQRVENLEIVIRQQNAELNKRKSEINERILQIENLDKLLKEEKINLDAKISNLEENLKNKSKQLHQRIEQIKEMNEMTDDIKQEKEEALDKMRQFENIFKSQKLEIDTKNSMIRKLELRLEDMQNEISQLRLENQKAIDDLNEIRRVDVKEEMKNKLKLAQNQSIPHREQSFESKETQTHNLMTLDIQLNTTETSNCMQNEKLDNEIDKLHMDLRIKENLMQTTNDTLVLKEAEIARLKTRIGLLERQNKQQNHKASLNS